MDVILNTWQGQRQMTLAKALTPDVSRNNPHDQALALAKMNATAIGYMAALMVEKGMWSITDAQKACGQFGIVRVLPSDPAPAMPSEWSPKA